MGAHFLLSIYEKVNIAELLASYQGVSMATGLDGARNLYEMNLRQPIAWLFGSEGQGLSVNTMALAQQKVMIPMAQGVESLNVAAAAAVCLFEERRQKLAVT
jgi:TrmH family RNA methyltransferase